MSFLFPFLKNFTIFASFHVLGMRRSVYEPPLYPVYQRLCTPLYAKHPGSCCTQAAASIPFDSGLIVHKVSSFLVGYFGQMHAHEDVFLHLECCSGGPPASHPHFRNHLLQVILRVEHLLPGGISSEHHIQWDMPCW